jgi:uncharacterized small protein (DUF1192 family)
MTVKLGYFDVDELKDRIAALESELDELREASNAYQNATDRYIAILSRGILDPHTRDEIRPLRNMAVDTGAALRAMIKEDK